MQQFYQTKKFVLPQMKSNALNCKGLPLKRVLDLKRNPFVILCFFITKGFLLFVYNIHRICCFLNMKEMRKNRKNVRLPLTLQFFRAII